MTGGYEVGIIERWKGLASAEAAARMRSDIGGLALVFAPLAACRGAWVRSLEGWDVTESQVVNRWLAQGENRGVEKGRGALQANLVRLLQKQFQHPVPQARRDRLSAADHDTLGRRFDLALDVASLEDFQGRVNGN
jgi:hypothetical protein